MKRNREVIKFYLFGDSICYGQLVSGPNTWANLLAQKIEELDADTFHHIIQNAGVNGNTTRQALERIHYDVTSHEPDFVLVQFGMNDCNYWETDKGMPRVSPKAFMANIEEIVEKCFLSGAKHCFLNTNHISLKGKFKHIDNFTYDTSNSRYSEIIRVAHSNLVASGFNVTLIDIEKEWNAWLSGDKNRNLQSLLLDDGIHLSPAGHYLYSQIITPVILPIIASRN